MIKHRRFATVAITESNCKRAAFLRPFLVELPGIDPTLYLGFCLLNCGFVAYRSGSVPLVTCAYVFES